MKENKSESLLVKVEWVVFIVRIVRQPLRSLIQLCVIISIPTNIIILAIVQFHSFESAYGVTRTQFATAAARAERHDGNILGFHVT